MLQLLDGGPDLAWSGTGRQAFERRHRLMGDRRLTFQEVVDSDLLIRDPASSRQESRE